MVYIIFSNKHSEQYKLELTSNAIDNNIIGLLTYFGLDDIHWSRPIFEKIYSEEIGEVLDQVVAIFRDRGDVITIYPHGSDADLINYRSIEIGFSFKEKKADTTGKEYLNGSILYYYKCEAPYSSTHNDLDELILDSLRKKTSFQHDFEFVLLKMKSYSSFKEIQEFKRSSDNTSDELIFNAHYTDQNNEKQTIQLKFELNIVSFLNEDEKNYIPNPIPLTNLTDKQKQLIEGILK